MSRRPMTPVEFASDPERKEAYLKWLDNPMTQLVFELGDYHSRLKKIQSPFPRPSTTEDMALQYAVNFGRFEMIDFLRSLDGWSQSHEEIEATYGDVEILSREYDYPKQESTHGHTDSGPDTDSSGA